MTQPRWLDEQEQLTWRAFLATTQLLDEALDRQLQHDSGMPHAYYRILVSLSDAADRTMRMSDLAAASQWSQSRLSHAVNRLEEAGWVSRRKCDQDKRVTYAILTGQGFSALAAAAPGHVEAVRRYLFDQLSRDQVGQLLAICEAVLPKLAAEAGHELFPGA
ncbi:MAG TPA: MarR family transcriptional regulator [Pseudonocardiaceae bacterium]|jgi:DNA-binding MarR family transcriptional regulator|nr:MarR family transcriptional regulator [Pseudonocardiaceae bacterium]